MTVRVLAICGGVGGAKLALGLSQVVSGPELAVAVNTGDDFTHFGLHISPDVDTVTYTLAGRSNRELGWGLAGETWAFMAQMETLGGDSWFRLGDRDLALHVWRSWRLGQGEGLAGITAHVAQQFGISAQIWPMSDDPVRTMVGTDIGRLSFQHYFVREQTRPQVREIFHEGAEAAAPNGDLLAALRSPSLEAVVICPSNPWLSVAPMLAMPALRQALAETKAPVVAVSPIVGGRAIKGPTAKLMAELALPVTAATVARFYEGLIDGYVLDHEDAALTPEVRSLGMEALVAQTVMTDDAAKAQLAREALDFARRLRK